MRVFLLLSIILSLFPLTSYAEDRVIKLPQPRFTSDVSVEEAILKRRSIRDYRNEPLTILEVSQILWSAQGITDRRMGFRTAPSAGALYPLEVYIVVGKVKDLLPGVYKYRPENHDIVLASSGDKRLDLYRVSLMQDCIRNAPVVIVISAVFERTTRKYGERGIRYVYMEAGHSAQNIYLQCEALGLGTVVVGAFDDEGVKKVLNLKGEESPLYLIPIGKK
ncbi:MAG: SagB/ThcOx family dehydrogenase [bacterium]|nr:SagB/ThcOx family dehydrogenase [bacterium]